MLQTTVLPLDYGALSIVLGISVLRLLFVVDLIMCLAVKVVKSWQRCLVA